MAAATAASPRISEAELIDIEKRADYLARSVEAAQRTDACFASVRFEPAAQLVEDIARLVGLVRRSR